ncbi:MAG TPA: hypothetical protein VN944_09400 [Nitrospiria bacterium]|nr:hypothetical protein [Nitrospiria bacterium]
MHEPSIEQFVHPAFSLAVAINMLFILLRIKLEESMLYIKRLEGVYEASRAIHQEQDSVALFNKIMEIAIKGTGAKYAAIRTFHQRDG